MSELRLVEHWLLLALVVFGAPQAVRNFQAACPPKRWRRRERSRARAARQVTP